MILIEPACNVCLCDLEGSETEPEPEVRSLFAPPGQCVCVPVCSLIQGVDPAPYIPCCALTHMPLMYHSRGWLFYDATSEQCTVQGS